MRYAIIEAGQVANVALADADFAAAQGWIAIDALDPQPSIGWTYDGTTFHAPPPPAPAIPESVSRHQARLALLGAGLLAQVDTVIDSLPSPQKEAARIDWEDASEFRRDSPLIAQLGPALGLTSAQIDALFVQAAAIP